MRGRDRGGGEKGEVSREGRGRGERRKKRVMEKRRELERQGIEREEKKLKER